MGRVETGISPRTRRALRPPAATPAAERVPRTASTYPTAQDTKEKETSATPQRRPANATREVVVLVWLALASVARRTHPLFRPAQLSPFLHCLFSTRAPVPRERPSLCLYSTFQFPIIHSTSQTSLRRSTPRLAEIHQSARESTAISANREREILAQVPRKELDSASRS